MSPSPFRAALRFEWRRVHGGVFWRFGLLMVPIVIVLKLTGPSQDVLPLVVAGVYSLLMIAHLLTPITAFERCLPLPPATLQRARLAAYHAALAVLIGLAWLIEVVSAALIPRDEPFFDARMLAAFAVALAAWPVLFIALHAPLSAARDRRRMLAWILIFIPYLLGAVGFITWAPPWLISAVAAAAALAAPFACRCWSRSELDVESAARLSRGLAAPAQQPVVTAGGARLARGLGRLPPRARWLILSQCRSQQLLGIGSAWMWCAWAVGARGTWTCALFVFAFLIQWNVVLRVAMDPAWGVGRLIDRRTVYRAASVPLIVPMIVAAAVAWWFAERGVAVMLIALLSAGSLVSLGWIARSASPGNPSRKANWLMCVFWAMTLGAVMGVPAMRRFQLRPRGEVHDLIMLTTPGAWILLAVGIVVAAAALSIGSTRARTVEILPLAPVAPA